MGRGERARARAPRVVTAKILPFRAIKNQQHYPDPGITYGFFRVLPYVPGGYVVIDTRRPPGYQRVARMLSIDDADQRCAELDARDGEDRR